MSEDLIERAHLADARAALAPVLAFLRESDNPALLGAANYLEKGDG